MAVLQPLTVPGHGAALSTELAIALQAAVAGANVIRASMGKPHAIEEKGIGDFVSEVDKNAETAVLSVISGAPFTASILSEESDPSMVAGSERMWLVDPLDGTSAFLFRVGNPFPSVLVALEEAGQPVVGVVLFPLTGECFYSHRGLGAFKDGVALQPPPLRRLQEIWIDMNQYGNARYETGMFAYLRNKLRTREGARLVTSFPPHSGVAMRLLDGTTGLSAVVHDNSEDNVKQAPWDIAAPRAILTEAGGCFVSLRTGRDIQSLDCEPMVVAGHRELAEEIVDLVR